MIAFVAASSTAFSFVTIFQCKPVAFAWNKDIVGGRCLNFNATAWAHAGINILQDFIIISLPVREILKLQLDRKKRIGLILIFGLGILYVLASSLVIHLVQGSC